MVKEATSKEEIIALKKIGGYSVEYTSETPVKYLLRKNGQSKE